MSGCEWILDSKSSKLREHKPAAPFLENTVKLQQATIQKVENYEVQKLFTQLFELADTKIKLEPGLIRN